MPEAPSKQLLVEGWPGGPPPRGMDLSEGSCRLSAPLKWWEEGRLGGWGGGLAGVPPQAEPPSPQAGWLWG